MKLIVRSALVVITFVMASPGARACFCIIPEVRQGFERAQVVFSGEVLEIMPPRSTDIKAPFADRVQTIRFKIDVTWKGPLWAEANVLDPIHSCFTIHPDRVGERYLIYGNLVPSSTKAINDVMIDPCNRTTVLSASPNKPGLFEHLYGAEPADDVRLLNMVLMRSNRRPRPDSIPLLKFLEP